MEPPLAAYTQRIRSAYTDADKRLYFIYEAVYGGIFMQPRTIRLPDEAEAEYRRRAEAAKKRLSVFLRDRLLDAAPPEPELNRPTIENEIDALKKEIEHLNEAALKIMTAITTLAKFQREMLFQSIADFCGEDTARNAIEATDEVIAGKRKALTVK